MKVALLTIWHEMNYGAELQAYATVKAIKHLGHEVEMIDIRLADCEYRNLKGRTVTFFSSFGPCQKKFENFWRHNIPVTRRYRTIEELQADPPKADIYMVGSDQVWNPAITGSFAKLYFLNFGEPSIRRVSYASSFGTNKWEYPELTEEIKGLLERFNVITCRERSGIGILNAMFRLHATHVLDPTLLFDGYPEFVGNIKQRNTLVYYPLSDDPDLENYSIALGQRLKMSVINNKAQSYIIKPIIWDRVSVQQWVKNIAEAQFVITRSFHGLVFSLLYRKNFAVLASPNNRGTRIVELLKLLGLSDRFYNSLIDLDNASPWAKEIDYTIVENTIGKYREESWKILQQMLTTNV